MKPPPTHAAQAAPLGDTAAAPLQSLELRIELTDDDRPEDRFSHHVNNARYFAFINRTFQAWYRPMGLRDPGAPFTAVMAHVSWDFLRQVMVPAAVLCRIAVVKAGRTSLEHRGARPGGACGRRAGERAIDALARRNPRALLGRGSGSAGGRLTR